MGNSSFLTSLKVQQASNIMRGVGNKIKCMASVTITTQMEASTPDSGIIINMQEEEDSNSQMELPTMEAGKTILCTVQVSSQTTWADNGQGSIVKVCTKAESKLSW